MITYSLVLCFLNLCICGYATPAKKVVTVRSGTATIIKKNFPFEVENRANGQYGYYTINSRSRTPVSFTQFFLIAEKYVSFFHYTAFKDIGPEAYKKKTLRDHLLHLYPFHFFW